ncbi:MAG: hypothetical protein ACK5SX_07675 [Sandaracinobacter sp.]
MDKPPTRSTRGQRDDLAETCTRILTGRALDALVTIDTHMYRRPMVDLPDALPAQRAPMSGMAGRHLQ